MPQSRIKFHIKDKDVLKKDQELFKKDNRLFLKEQELFLKCLVLFYRCRESVSYHSWKFPLSCAFLTRKRLENALLYTRQELSIKKNIWLTASILCENQLQNVVRA